jgi:hypothetical protein
MVATMTGYEIVPGLRPVGLTQGLYLDWESNVHEHNRRVESLCRTVGLDKPPMIYRSNYRALSEDLGGLRREVAQRAVGFVCVDSAVPASGDDIKDTSAPRQLFNALRSLGDGVTRLVLAHMSKAEAERETGRARALGSVMYENLARSVWELRKSEHGGGDALVVGLFHRKINGGRLRPPFALRIVYGTNEQPAAVERADLREYPDLADRMPMTDRLRDLLRMRARTTTEIAEELGVTATAALNMLKRRPDMQQVSAGGGRGNPSVWGLAAPDDREPPGHTYHPPSEEDWTL